MRTEVQPGKTDENWNRQTGQTESSPGHKQYTKESHRRVDVARRKRVIFGTPTWTIPCLLRFNRRARATGCYFDRSTNKTSDCERDEHSEKNPLPVLVSPPPCDGKRDETNDEMFGPVAKSAHVAHELSKRGILMIPEKILDRLVKVERGGNDHYRDRDSD